MTFVAAAVLQLVGEGKLSLDEPVDRAAPGLLPKDWRITVRQLLQHTSLLYDYTQDSRWLTPSHNRRFGHVWKPRQLLALSLTRPRGLQPLSRRLSGSYSDYIALGLLIETVTHHGLASELQHRIFRPLRLHSTSFDTRPLVGRGYAHGYIGTQFIDVSNTSTSWAWAAGGVVSTAADIASFYRELLGGHLLAPKLLREMESVRPFQATTHDSYGLGLWQSGSLWLQAHVPWRCNTLVWGHNGDAVGYLSLAWANRSGSKQFVILTNADRGFAYGVPGAWAWNTASALSDVAATAYCG